MQQLKVGSTLQGDKYRIEKVLGQGGFGITYLAYQELLDRKVCIKEFFFKEYCERDEATSQVSLGTTANKEMVERFMAKFVKEARTISQMEHPNIIRIFDVFKENNTAYYVMEYIEGDSLADMVNRRGCIPEEEALCYIRCVADALDYVHQKHINHLDVKPGNILVRNSDKRVLLIDFGLSKQYDASGNQTSTTPVGISHGYAPIEQYKQNGVQEFSPQTDIYALGATLYKLLSGNTPPQPSDIINDGLPELPIYISENVRNAVKHAMQIRKADRPQEMKTFVKLLLAQEQPSCKPIATDKLEKEDKIKETGCVNTLNEETQFVVEKKKEEVHNPYIADNVSQTSTFRQSNSEEETDNVIRNSIILIGVIVLFCFCIWYVSRSNNSYTPSSTNTEVVAAADTFDVRVNNKRYTNSKGVTFTYSGEMLNGAPHGQGVGVYSEGTYKGNYYYGLREGQATYVTTDGSNRYEGTYSNDKYNQGRLIVKDGSYYVGTFYENKPYNGTWYNQNGSVYVKVKSGRY